MVGNVIASWFFGSCPTGPSSESNLKVKVKYAMVCNVRYNVLYFSFFELIYIYRVSDFYGNSTRSVSALKMHSHKIVWNVLKASSNYLNAQTLHLITDWSWRVTCTKSLWTCKVTLTYVTSFFWSLDFEKIFKIDWCKCIHCLPHAHNNFNMKTYTSQILNELKRKIYINCNL